MINGLSLFSGIGGLDVALSEWVRPIAYCEIDSYCQGVLLSRMASGDLVHAPIWDDIRTLRIRPQEVDIDIIYCGFPCQDISIAGLGKGLAGERSGLFFEIVRLAKEIKPTFIFLENVPAITSRGGLQVVREITKMGYDCRWCIISAASVGALHKRERWFLLAHSNSTRLQEQRNGKISAEKKYPRSSNSCEDVADSRCLSERGEKEPERSHDQPTRRSRFWETQSGVGKLADGVSDRVAKLRAIGNAVVPQQAKEAFKILMGLK